MSQLNEVNKEKINTRDLLKLMYESIPRLVTSCRHFRRRSEVKDFKHCHFGIRRELIALSLSGRSVSFRYPIHHETIYDCSHSTHMLYS